MAEMKTSKTTASVAGFLNAVENPKRRADAKTIKALFDKVTGFSPRKQAMSIYIMSGFSDRDDLLAKLGKHKTGRSCLYINKLEDVDLKVLETLIRKDIAYMKKKYEVNA